MVPYVRDGACICVDSIGIGSSVLDFIKGLNLNVFAVNGPRPWPYTVAGNSAFSQQARRNVLEAARGAGPDEPQPHCTPSRRGSLLADLCAVRYKVVTMGKVTALQMREKDEIRELLGRSPDKG